MEQVATYQVPVYIAGHFNIRLDRSDDAHAAQLRQLVDCYGLLLYTTLLRPISSVARSTPSLLATTSTDRSQSLSLMSLSLITVCCQLMMMMMMGDARPTGPHWGISVPQTI